MKRALRRIALSFMVVIMTTTTMIGQSANIALAKGKSSDLKDVENQLEEALKGLDDLGDIDFNNLSDTSKEKNTKKNSNKSTIQTDMMIASGNNFTLGLKTDGTVISAGMSVNGADQVGDWTNMIMIACGFDHSVGLKSDGTVIAVGSNGSGECDVDGWKDIMKIAAGLDHTIGLKKNGTVVATGSDEYGKLEVKGWKDIVAVAAGSHFTVGLKKDGTVLAVGKDCSGILDVSDWTDIVAISASYSNILGLKKDGTVVNTMRSNTKEFTDVISIAASAGYGAGLKKDGTVITNTDTVNTSTWKDIIAISASASHLAGLKKDGTVVATDAGDSFDLGQCDVTGWRLKVGHDIKTTSSGSKIIVDGTKFTIETYTIDKDIYVKMTDLAFMLKNTIKKFSVTGDGVKKEMKLTLGSIYKPTDTKLSKSDGQSRVAVKNPLEIDINEEKVGFTAYKIAGDLYFKLSDVMKKLNITAKISGKFTITINTK